MESELILWLILGAIVLYPVLIFFVAVVIGLVLLAVDIVDELMMTPEDRRQHEAYLIAAHHADQTHGPE